MIQLPLDPSPFPQFHPGPGGPAGGISLADSRSRTLADFAAFPAGSDGDGDRDGITTDAVYLETKTGLEDGSRIIVNIRGIILKEHGDAPDKDPMETVEDYEFSVTVSSPLATPKDDDEMFGELIAVDGAPIVTITAPHGSGKMDLVARDSQEAFKQAGAGEDLGDLIFTFTADGGGMATGSEVEITIPGAFPTEPFEPASDSDNRSGAVTLDGVVDTDFTVNDKVMTAKLKGPLAHGETLTFTYKGVKAPDTEEVLIPLRRVQVLDPTAS